MSEKRKDNIKSLKANVIGFLNGSIVASDFMRRQIPFIFFLSVLALVYIANRHHAERIYRETEKTKKEIEDLRSAKIEIQSNLMIRSRRESLIKLLREKESTLIESKTAPLKIEYKKFEKEK